MHGYVRQETAYRIDDSREWTKIRQQGLLIQTARLSDAISLKATQRVWYDAVYDLTDNFPETVEHDQEWELELRETYVDYSSGPWDLRVGKQQIVWGDTVGLFVADIVNAKDLREYVLPEFDLIRIPQWGVDAEWSQDIVHAEFAWLPVLQFHHLGVSGSEFEFPLPVEPSTPTTWTDPSKPPSSFDNGEVGGRLSVLWGGWDVSTFYWYSWDKFPVLFRTIQSGVVHYAPAYRRAHYFGGSFSKEVRDIVLKGELLINPAAFLTTNDTTDPDGIVTRGTVDYVLGADYTWFGRIETNVQLLQRFIVNHPRLLEEDRWRTHVSFRVKTDLFNNKVEPELLVMAGLTETDFLYRPKIAFHLTDALSWQVGADIFQGHRTGLFGRFNEKSRLYTELTYHF